MSNKTQKLRANNNRVPVIGNLLVAISNMVNNFLAGLTDKVIENNTVGGTSGFEASTLQLLHNNNQALFDNLYGSSESSETSGDQNQNSENTN